jgi:ABC-type sugar transport system substrate-binding protein
MSLHALLSATRRRKRTTAFLAMAAIASLAAAGCSSSPSSSSTAAPPASAPATGAAASPSASASSSAPSADVQQVINTALQSDVPVSQVPPLMAEALSKVNLNLTPDQITTAYNCWKASSCTLGSGNLTLAEADGFGDNTWRQFSKMDVILQAMQYPQIGKFIYTNAHGTLSQYQSDLRSLTAQGAKLIVAYNDFGPAAYPAFTAAQRAGAYVSTFVGPNDGAPASAITTRVQPDICQAGKDMAQATNQAIGGSGPVAYFTGTPGNPEDLGWQKCATQAGINSVFNADTNWTPTGAQTAASALIASGKQVKAILYSYSNPVPNIIKAYQAAGKPVPAIITWTTDNGTLCLNQKSPFPLYLTNALNWAARVSVTALVDKAGGQSVPDAVLYPMPFTKADPSACSASGPADYPGTSALVPAALTAKILGS